MDVSHLNSSHAATVGTYCYSLLHLSDQLWVIRCHHSFLEPIGAFGGFHGLVELVGSHVSAGLQEAAMGLLKSRREVRL